MYKKYSLADINQHFIDNDKATHKVIHSKQISDDVLKSVKREYVVATKKQGDLTMYIICKTHKPFSTVN